MDTLLESPPAKGQYPTLSAPKLQLVDPSPTESTPQSSQSNDHSLAALWARKYYAAVTNPEDADQLRKAETLKEVTSKEGREHTVNKLRQKLTLASAQGWSMTEKMLSDEIIRHGIDPDLINPLEIAEDTRHLFQKALNAYALRATPRHLSVVVGRDFGLVRSKYTKVEPRTIGFVSLQFHNTGKMLLEWLSATEQSLWMPYLKVMDDHMYMPLRAAYEAAANHSYDSPVLRAVQHLLPISSKIAYKVANEICRLHPNYRSYNGPLTQLTVKTSSIRDVEMFQVYLCLCVLEDNMRSVQQELFPLSVMLYPRLQVSWKLVQDMLQALGWAMRLYLSPEDIEIFLPYLRTLSEMFSSKVFQNA
ncbi:MAG: hypothetical protein KME08_17740 [Aphanothece sp. CMT-3BRIN-NPC111]|jgi:hypothetical protein|nr:hypothetical protein [Aphanothece sp. CMT-3BRIN-NPC111]